jgi:hypothetical protein
VKGGKATVVSSSTTVSSAPKQTTVYKQNVAVPSVSSSSSSYTPYSSNATKSSYTPYSGSASKSTSYNKPSAGFTPSASAVSFLLHFVYFILFFFLF